MQYYFNYKHLNKIYTGWFDSKSKTLRFASPTDTCKIDQCEINTNFIILHSKLQEKSNKTSNVCKM